MCRTLARSFGAIGVIDRDRKPAEQVAAELGQNGVITGVGVVDVSDVDASRTPWTIWYLYWGAWTPWWPRRAT